MRRSHRPIQGYVSILVVILAVGLSSCTKEKGKLLSARQRPWLRWSVASAPVDLESPCRSRQCWREASLTGEGLVSLDATGGSLQVTGLLADQWTWQTPTELIFHLRPQVRWSDGSLFGAAQIVGSWRSLLQSCANEPAAALLFPVINAAAFCEGKLPFSQVGVHIVDKATIRLELLQPSIAFPRVFAHPALWPWSPVATLGPFLRPPSSPSHVYRFARNPYYHAAGTAIAGVEMQVQPSSELRVAWFRDQATDLVDDLGTELVARLESEPGFHTARSGKRVSLLFNASRRPFTETAVRQAFAAAIAREEPIHLLKWPYWAAVGFSLALREGASAHGIGFSLSQAAQWLHSVSWDAGQLHFAEEGQVRPFPRPTLVWTGFSGAEPLAENLQAQWMKSIGMRVELAGQTVESQWNSLNPSLALVEYAEDPLIPWAPLLRFTEGHGLGQWRNEDFDRWIAQASHAADTATLEGALGRAESLLVDQTVLVVPLLSEGRGVLQSTRLRQLSENPVGFWNFAAAVMD